MRLLCISDLHLGESSASTTHPGVIRQGNTAASKTFEELIPTLQAYMPDLVVELGDSLRDSHVTDVDLRNLTKALTLVGKLAKPTIHLYGNHELRAFSVDELSDIYRQSGLNPEFYGYKQVNNVQIIWLDFVRGKSDRATMSQERLDWLKETINPDKALLLFSHYSLCPIEPSGSFYFDGKENFMRYEDYEKVLSILPKNAPVVAVNAHVHLATYQVRNNVHFISNSAFSENLAASKYPENNPGIYSILDIDDQGFVFTSYSEKFAFFKAQAEF